MIRRGALFAVMISLSCVARVESQSARTAAREAAAVVREGPHTGQTMELDCDRRVAAMEVGQGIICALHVRKMIGPERWTYEPLDGPFTFQSGDSTIALTAANGSLIARRAGSTEITATALGATAYATVNVYARIESFRFVPSDTTLPIGGSVRVRAVARDSLGHEFEINPRLMSRALWGSAPIVTLDSAPRWHELLVHAVNSGRIEMLASYGARVAKLAIVVSTDSLSRVIAVREIDSVNAERRKRAPSITVWVVDSATQAPVQAARIQIRDAKGTTDAAGRVVATRLALGDVGILVRCPWQKREGPVAATRSIRVLATTDTVVTVPIPLASCEETDARSVVREVSGHYMIGVGMGIFAPCAPFDTLPLPPGVDRKTAFVIFADSAKQRAGLLFANPRSEFREYFVRWTGELVGPGAYPDARGASYKITVHSVAEARAPNVRDCRK